MMLLRNGWESRKATEEERMEKEWEVRIVNGERVETVRLPDGASPFEAIRARVSDFGHACNGNGTCGKCRIHIAESFLNMVSPPAEAERRLLGAEQVASGHRLACLVHVLGDVTLEVETRERKAKIAAESGFVMPVPNPAVKRVSVRVPQPSLADQRADVTRLLSVLPADTASAGLPTQWMGHLPAMLKHADGQITAVLHEGRVAGLLPGDCTADAYGIAVDIGTTTLAGCLLDLRSGAVLATETMLNGQKRHGTDVISRIRHTMDIPEGAEQLRNTILADLRGLSIRLCAAATLEPDSIDEWVLTGNTTMGHLLMGWPSAAIAAAPFIPVHVQRVVLPANHLWRDASRQTRVVLLPGVSAYVGADTVSAVLACGLAEAEKPSLVVDLGTNGELVLGSRQGMLACSTAAGPAFEGAGIRFGMGAVDGAIDSLSRNGTPAAPVIGCTVLGGVRAAGLCGTGLLDAISVLLEAGVIDETGRLQDADDLPDDFPPSLLDRLTEVEGQTAFILVPAGESEHGRDIVLTQRDVREFQNAKAAVCAGIETLADAAGISLAEVEAVYLAGGLGTWLNPDSAIRTGLIPSPLSGRVRPVGNAALAGAMQSLLCVDARKKADAIAADIRFVELSGRRDFNDRYVEAMLFGEA